MSSTSYSLGNSGQSNVLIYCQGPALADPGYSRGDGIGDLFKW